MGKQSANIRTRTQMPETGAAPSRSVIVAATWSAMALAAVCWALAALSIDRSGSSEAAAHNLRSLWPYWLASAMGWTGLTLLWRSLRNKSAPMAMFGRTTSVILGIAMAARLAVLIVHEPALSDDVYRYVFDGRNLAHGLNPYLTLPADRMNALDRGAPEHWRGESALVNLVAFPEVTTPYFPLSQYVFGSLGVACEWGGWASPSASARVFRAAFTLLELALMLVLAGALRSAGLSAWWLALYAWHPLPLGEIAGSGHQDVVGITLMVIALALASGANAGRLRWRAIGWAAPLAGAAMVKPVAGIGAVMSLRRAPVGAWMLCAVVALIVWFVLAMPLRWMPGQPAFAAWRGTADWMAEKSAHFGGVYEPVLLVVRHAMPDGPQREPGFNLRQERTARRVCAGLFATTMVVVWLRWRDRWPASAIALTAMTLCAATSFPWYLLWAFALFVIGGAGGWTLWVYSLTISWGYVVFTGGKGHALGLEWTVTPWMLAAAYIPVLLAIATDLVKAIGRS
jgi:hypothetical protein